MAKNTKIKISEDNCEVDLPFVSGANKYYVTVDPVTGSLGKAGLVAGGGLPFNGERPIGLNVPGLQGLTIHGATTTQVLNNFLALLYPLVEPSCVLIVSNPEREYGASTDVILYYNAYPGDLALDSLYVNGVLIDLDQLQGSINATTAPNVTTTFSMVATDDEAHVAVGSATVTYGHKRFWFQSSTNLLTNTSTDISAILNGAINKEFAVNKSQDRNFALADEYVYFAYPASFGNASFIVGNLPNTAYQLRTFDYTNLYGYTEPYILYRSGGKGTGQINVKVN